MKTIYERYKELFWGITTNYSSEKCYKIINKEYFKGKLKIKIERKEIIIQPYTPTGCSKVWQEITIDGRVFDYNPDALDYLQNIYDLQSMKRKINNL